MKSLIINSSISDRVEYKTIKIIQGNLKDLMSEDYLKFKKNMLKNGFVDPIDVWVNTNEDLHCIGGTQRLRMLYALENEGYTIPSVPINRIEAKTLREAKNILLSLASQYGKFNNDGLLEFVVEDFDDLADISDNYSLMGVSYDEIVEEKTKDHTDKKEKKPIKCPNCGYER